MSRRSLALRLESLEQRIGGLGADLATEAATYGELAWGNTAGPRCYIGSSQDGARIAIVGGAQDGLVYEIVGIDPEALGWA